MIKKVLKKKAFFDMFLNILAVSIPIAILQFIAYPLAAKKLGAESYGFMITLYSLWMTISNTIGSELNVLRLLRTAYEDIESDAGTFAYLLRKWLIINTFLIGTLTCIYGGGLHFETVTISIIISILFSLKAYLEVYFRINLNYIAIVISNFLQGIGFLIGSFFVYLSKCWLLIFLFGYLFSCTYCIFKAKLIFERPCKTKLYSKINKEYNELLFAAGIGSIMNYADKLVLYPLMGGYAVSIYYTATILGKIIGMFTGPINSVILSYINKWDNSRRTYLNKIIFFGVIISIMGYIVVILSGKMIIGYLYPQWVDDVMKYLPITTITIMIFAIIALIQPFVLKYCDLKWQILINGIGAAISFLLSLALWKLAGLMGFCIGSAIGALIKLIIMLCVYYKTPNNLE